MILEGSGGLRVHSAQRESRRNRGPVGGLKLLFIPESPQLAVPTLCADLNTKKYCECDNILDS